MTTRTNPEGYSVANESRWRYPANGEPAPHGTHVQLLTEGGKQVPGVWTSDGGFIAWAPNIKRDKALEEKLFNAAPTKE